MGESLTKRCRVRDEGLRVVNRCQWGEKGSELSHYFDLSAEEVWAKLVPAAAVRRASQTLFGITGLKGCVGGAESWV